MLIFNKEKYYKSVNYSQKKIDYYKRMGVAWELECDGKEAKYIDVLDSYKVGNFTVYPEWCIDTEEKGETMKELLERWKKTKDADLIQAIEIIEDLQDKYESLEEEFEDYKKDVDENYEQKPFDPYEEYGISESDFH